MIPTCNKCGGCVELGEMADYTVYSDTVAITYYAECTDCGAFGQVTITYEIDLDDGAIQAVGLE